MITTKGSDQRGLSLFDSCPIQITAVGNDFLRCVMIRKAIIEDIDQIENSYTELLTYEQEHGTNSNWILGVYPTRNVAEKAFEEDTLYVLEENGKICASMILNQNQPEEYAGMDWMYKADPKEVLVLHTLCIPPSAAGRGYGSQMVKYTLDFAKKMGMKAVRLDTWVGNKPAASLYTKMGFRPVGVTHVMLNGLIPSELVLFEFNFSDRM